MAEDWLDQVSATRAESDSIEAKLEQLASDKARLEAEKQNIEAEENRLRAALKDKSQELEYMLDQLQLAEDSTSSNADKDSNVEKCYGDPTEYFGRDSNGTAQSKGDAQKHKVLTTEKDVAIDRVPADGTDALGVWFEHYETRDKFPKWGLTFRTREGDHWSLVRFINCEFDEFSKTLFENCSLKNVMFVNCTFVNVRFVGAEMEDTTFKDCKFERGFCNKWWPQSGEVFTDQTFGSGEFDGPPQPTDQEAADEWLAKKLTAEDAAAAKASR